MTRTPRGRARHLVLVSLGALLLPLLLAAASGCAFDRKWKHLSAAAAERADLADASRADPLAGRWVGTWHSERNNHRGKLRAILTPARPGAAVAAADAADAAPAAYRADFDATYLGLLRFGYSMTLAARREGDVIHFHGEENLGRLAGGVYRYEGTADGRTFDCTYRSKSDHGKFQMTRPAR